MWFVFLKSQVCFRLPPDLASRQRPCLPLMIGAINLHKGLSPSSQRPCWAHKQNWERLNTIFPSKNITYLYKLPISVYMPSSVTSTLMVPSGLILLLGTSS